MEETDNYRKHTTQSFIQRVLINNFFNTLLSLVRTIKVDAVLDVGCGEGFTLQKLKQAHLGSQYEGIEYSEIAIALGKRIHPDLVFRHGDIYQLPYKDKAFDLVICTEVLEHLENPKAALTELVRVSKRYCLLSVPNEPFFRGGNFLRGKNWSRWGDDIEHIQHWSNNSFENFVEKGGIKILIKKTPLPWTMILGEKLR